MAKRVKITDEMLKDAVECSASVMEVLRRLGLREAGGTHSHYKKRIMSAGISVSHFTGSAHNKGKSSGSRKTADEILILRTEGHRGKSHQLVRAMIESGVVHKCALCGQAAEWMGNKLTLDVDHIDENWLDDRLENLRFLCPNCHSQLSRNLIV